MVSMGACFYLVRVWLAGGLEHYLPAVIALAAAVHFIINTVLVSGVLSLLQGKRLAEMCSQWYVWSFPYYLIGVAVVGLFPGPGRAVSGEAWLILLPLVYLVHFFLGLVKWHASSPALADQAETSLPRGARMFVAGVVAGGAILLAASAFFWESHSPLQFVSYLALAVLAATLKIRVPGLKGTITPCFVLVLAAIAGLSLAETAVIAAATGLVQVLWRPARRASLAQVLFNPASVALSSALAYGLCRVVLPPWIGHSVTAELVLATLVLYGSNSLMMATVLALVERRPLGAVWQLCYFWSLPYYLVGAAAAGLMTATWRTANWPASLLVLPLMGLVYVSYRVHVRQAVDRGAQAAV